MPLYNTVGYAKTYNNSESTFWGYIDLYTEEVEMENFPIIVVIKIVAVF